MTELVFGLLVYLCSMRLGWQAMTWYRARAAARRERIASCVHEWEYVDAFDDPCFPVRLCRKCPAQENLKTPVPCPHCGENINAGMPK